MANILKIFFKTLHIISFSNPFRRSPFLLVKKTSIHLFTFKFIARFFQFFIFIQFVTFKRAEHALVTWECEFIYFFEFFYVVFWSFWTETWRQPDKTGNTWSREHNFKKKTAEHQTVAKHDNFLSRFLSIFGICYLHWS